MLSVYHLFVRASRSARVAAIPALALLLTLGPITPQTLNVPSGGSAWKTECLDCPAGFGALTHRALAIDASGHLHVAYGGRLLYYAVYDGQSWRHETVDDAPWIGSGASLVLDPSGSPRIAYCDDENVGVKYAYRDVDGWHVETFYWPRKAEAEPQGAGGSCAASLALDRGGEPHIAFFARWPGYNLWYAHRDAGSWRAEVVDSTQYAGMEPSLALDSQDHPHIAYYAGYPSYKLWYAYWEDGWWHRQRLQDLPGHDGDMGQYPSLALDAQNHFHISYYDATEGNLEYMAGSPRTWDIEIVDADGDAGRSTSLVLDDAGQPHVSYYAAAPVPAVRYAYRDPVGWHVDTATHRVEVSGDTALALDSAGRPFIGFAGAGEDTVAVLQVASLYPAGGWIASIVDRPGEAGQDSSLVLDVAGYPHISYDAADYGGALARARLEYTWRDASGWHRETVDSGQYPGWGSSLALGADGRPHISYRVTDMLKPEVVLRYAYHDDSGWHIETADPAAWNGMATSLALDPQGNPHVAYIADGLRHAYRDEDGWHVETIDPAGDPGARVSLAIDTLGGLHISYPVTDIPKPDVTLHYAYRDGDGWHLETVDADGEVGEYSSLALDAAGHPHIAYYAGYPYHDLRYAYRDTVAWHIERAWTGDDVGRFPSLVLDAAGWPHISCHCRLPYGWTALCLVVRDHTTWGLSLMTEGTAIVGAGTSLALDRAGRPHVTYNFDGGLKYGYFVALRPLYLPLVTRG